MFYACMPGWPAGRSRWHVLVCASVHVLVHVCAAAGRGGKRPDGPVGYFPPAVDVEAQTAHRFAERSVRNGFVRKVLGIVSLQLAVTVGFAAVCMYVPPIKVRPPAHGMVGMHGWWGMHANVGDAAGAHPWVVTCARVRGTRRTRARDHGSRAERRRSWLPLPLPQPARRCDGHM